MPKVNADKHIIAKHKKIKAGEANFRPDPQMICRSCCKLQNLSLPLPLF